MAEDGEVFDSWEDQEDQGILDKRLNEMKVKAPKTATASVLEVREDTGRTEFTPTVRILKRNPVTEKTNANTTNNAVSKPMKTLEQREAEYAEARMRIFGSLEEQPLDGAEEGEENGDQTGDQSDKSISLVQKFEASPSHNAVSRQPKGPDGSRGFNLER